MMMVSYPIVSCRSRCCAFLVLLSLSFSSAILGGSVNLGTAGSYAILAKAGISTVPDSTVNGDIGVSPVLSGALTGFSLSLDIGGQFSTSSQVNGKAFAADYGSPTPGDLTTAVNDMEAAFTNAAGRVTDVTNFYYGNLETGDELTSNVYTFDTDVNINGDIYFSGGGVYIIQIAGNLVQAVDTTVHLENGALAKNIFWQVSGNVQIEAGAHMEGYILGQTDVTFLAGSSLNGCIYAQTRVNLDNAVIDCTGASTSTSGPTVTPGSTTSRPTRAPVTAHPTPTPAPGGGGPVTAQPTPGPRDGVAMGDPHLLTWGNVWFDYMGECDLVFVDAPSFGDGLGLTAQIRTKARYSYSYIESAAIKIGDDVLQVAAYGQYFVDGVSNAEMPMTLSGYPVKHTKTSDLEHLFEIELGEDMFVYLKAFKDLVSIKFHNIQAKDFIDSKGILGDFETGSRVARDGTTIMKDDNEYGQEWQVRETDPVLFITASGPQYPQRCVVPTPDESKEKRRRLGETISLEAAMAACFHWTMGREQCVYDIMATGDVTVAEAGAF
jgi:hypothetical protein